MKSMFADAKKELANLRRSRTKGYCVPFGRIHELERFIETRGTSHGMPIHMVILTRFEYSERKRAKKLVAVLKTSGVYRVVELNDSGLDLTVYVSEDEV